MDGKSALYGALFGLLPIGWVVLNVIFMYQLTSEVGLFDVLQKSITGITTDRACAARNTTPWSKSSWSLPASFSPG
jgi:L-lactate permease